MKQDGRKLAIFELVCEIKENNCNGNEWACIQNVSDWTPLGDSQERLFQIRVFSTGAEWEDGMGKAQGKVIAQTLILAFCPIQSWMQIMDIYVAVFKWFAE